MTRRTWLIASAAFVLVLIAAALALYMLRPLPPRLTLRRADFTELVGWGDDGAAAVIPAFLRSCAKVIAKPAGALLDPRPKNADFGLVGDWQTPCTEAGALPPGDDAAARHFFERGFIPLLAANNGNSEGLFTGYFEITLRGSRHRGGPHQTPLYRRPPDPQRTAYTRAEIEDGALAGKGLELAWVDDPVDAFFLEIQGSGLLHLADGSTIRVGYDGSNAKTYVAVGRLLLERGELPREQLTMAAIRGWMAAHPKEGAALRRDNPSYVFFREIHGDGPLGAERVALTAGRSLAVDRAFLPLGMPMWLDVKQRFTSGVIRRLVVAQDTGGAIKGPVRGDLFWGHGKDAAAGAGAMNASGRYWLLLPRPVADRLAPGS